MRGDFSRVAAWPECLPPAAISGKGAFKAPAAADGFKPSARVMALTWSHSVRASDLDFGAGFGDFHKVGMAIRLIRAYGSRNPELRL